MIKKQHKLYKAAVSKATDRLFAYKVMHSKIKEGKQLCKECFNNTVYQKSFVVCRKTESEEDEDYDMEEDEEEEEKTSKRGL